MVARSIAGCLAGERTAKVATGEARRCGSRAVEAGTTGFKVPAVGAVPWCCHGCVQVPPSTGGKRSGFLPGPVAAGASQKKPRWPKAPMAPQANSSAF
jgi:hypothetical protein